MTITAENKTCQNTGYCVRFELSGLPESFPDELEAYSMTANQLSFHM